MGMTFHTRLRVVTSRSYTVEPLSRHPLLSSIAHLPRVNWQARVECGHVQSKLTRRNLALGRRRFAALFAALRRFKQIHAACRWLPSCPPVIRVAHRSRGVLAGG